MSQCNDIAPHLTSKSRLTSGLARVKALLIACFLFVSLPLSAQLEYAHWIWGDSNHLDFNSGGPVYSTLPNSLYYSGADHRRDFASISNRNGNLLFYTNGRKVYDKNHNLIPNGNDAFYNDEHEWICILPRPCRDSIYDIFYLKETLEGASDRFAYHTVNMNGNNGLGVVAQRYVKVDSFLGKSMDACRHANNKDYWIMVRHWNAGNTFYAYQVSDTGIASTPVTSTTGPAFPSGTNIPINRENMVFSPNAEYVAVSSQIGYINHFPQRLYAFDNATGQVSFICDLNDASLPNADENRNVGFSPDSKKLYISATPTIWQFDLSSGNALTISNSGQVVTTYSSLGLWNAGFEMQIGIDSAMYINRGNTAATFGNYSHWLSVIPNPNESVLSGGLTIVQDSIFTGQKTMFHLPHVMHNLYIDRDITFNLPACTGDTTTFAFNKYIYLDSTHWHIGDISSAQQFFVSDSAANVVFDSAGLYPIMAVTYSGCRLDTFHDTIAITLSPAPDLGPDTILCEGDTIAFANNWNYTYLWSTGDTTTGIQVLQPDTFWLELSNVCGVARDTIVVDSIITAFVEFGLDDTLLCEGESLLIDATVEQGTYLWHDGSTDSVFYATGPDTVWVEALNVCNITPATDTMIVRFTDIPVIPELDSVLCSGQSYFIDLTTDSVSKFVWYDGHTGAFDTITFQNTYWVKEWNVCGHDSSDFMVAFVNDPQTLLGDDTVLCISDSMVLDASTPFGKYVWNTGDTSGAIVVDESYLSGDSNHYIVTVYNACKSDTDDVIIAADYYLDIDLGDNQLVCLDDSVTIDAGEFPRTDYKWSPSQNGEHQFGFRAQQDVTQSVTASNACGAFSDTVVISVDQPLLPELGDDRIVCFGDTVMLGVEDFPRTDFRWSSRPEVLTQPDDGASITLKAGSSQLPGDTVTTYIITLSNECGPTSDSVHVQVDSLPELFTIDSIYFCEDSFATVHIVKSDIDYLEWQDGSREVRRKIDEQASWPVTFYNHCGLTEQRLFSVRKLPPHIQLDSPQKICEHVLVLEPLINKGEPTTWSPQNQMSYLWNDGSTLDELVVDHPGHYGVTITNAFGCYDSARVQVKTCGSDWYIPNAFTPSGDGHNDLWRPKGEGFYNYTITIFDRWGNAVYTFDDQSPGWDGTVGNQPVSGGIYTYNMTVFSEDFPKGTLVNGTVMVVR